MRAAALPLLLAAAYRSAVPPPSAQVNQLKQAGAWKGTGNKTIGFVSETGVFRIN
jgi:hypothetical protein